MIVALTLDLPGEARCVRTARLMGRTLLEDLQVQETVAEDIEFVLGELCANAVRHAQATHNRFFVRIELHPDHVNVVVEDRGQGFDTQDVAEPGSLRSDFGGEMRVGGFGMGLVRAFCDKLEFERARPQGTIAHAEKSLCPPSSAPHPLAYGFGEGSSSGGVSTTLH
ncbi:MAG: ATP-binding protein [Armatimonadetes bacterium]|nr:ATP-binding protein [Armatimonadota bacterium]